jgi:hypothetical protein
MSTKKKGMLTVSGEWARHLRPRGRRQFWSVERMTAQQAVLAEARDELVASTEDVPRRAADGKSADDSRPARNPA